MRLKNKTALVTGASRGIGRAIALALAEEGVRTVLVARSLDGLEETRRLLGQPRAQILCADLRDEREIERVWKLVNEHAEAIDIIINAAGVWHDEHQEFHGPPLVATPVGQIDDMLAVGLRASMLLNRLILPKMISNRSGKILQIACGFAGPHEAVGWLHYYVTNKAIEALTTGLAAELREHEIQVNCIAPWFVASEAVVRFFPDESKKALNVNEVARLAVFLVSAEADHISGQIIELRSKTDHA